MKYEDHLVLRSVFCKVQTSKRVPLIDLMDDFCHDKQENGGESHAA